MKLNFHENSYLLYLTILLGFFALSLIIAVFPSINLQNSNEPLPDSLPLTEEQQRGLDLYVAEGCLYCHTQQVRPLEMDEPYGRPSAPGDFARFRPIDVWRFTPSILGSERTGPDLSDIGNRQPSETWHYIHLYNPRAVVKQSIMQPYPWFFEVKENPGPDDIVIPVPEEYAPSGGSVVAGQKAKDMVAYLLALKQPPIPGAIPGASGPSGEDGDTVSTGDGGRLYNTYCASCHQQSGQGVQGVFPPLVNDPVVSASDPTRHIEIVLFGLSGEIINGIQYATAMPPHKDTLSDEQVALIVNYERVEWGPGESNVSTEDVAKIRKEGVDSK